MGVHVPFNKQGFMYIWPEVVAKRGSRETTSCLSKFVNDNLATSSNLIFWSDTCGGQNRHFIMTTFCLRLLNELSNLESIIHRFPESGHSFLPNDRDFGDIEKKRKHKEAIYTPHQYAEIMEQAKNMRPLKVHHMESEDFFDVSAGALFSNLNKPIDTDGNHFSWLLIHEFKYEKKFFGFKFKYDLTDEYRTCYLGPANKTRASKRPKHAVFKDCPILHPNGVPLKAKKLEDLKVFMKYIPPVHQTFYLAIQDAQNAESDGDDSDAEEIDMML